MTTAQASHLPKHVTIFVNWACNLRCRECWLYGDSAENNSWLKGAMKENLPFSVFEKLVDELLEWQPRTSISIMGGEPFIYKDLPRIVDYLKSRSPDSHIDVSTNGTLVERFSTIDVQNGFDMVYFSLDGSTPEINDPIRGKGCFERAMEGVRHYLAVRNGAPGKRIKIGLNFTVTGLNYRDLVSMAQLAEGLGVDELSVNFMMYFSSSEGNGAARGFSKVIGKEFTSWSGFENGELASGVDEETLRRILVETENTVKKTRLLIAPTRYPATDRAKYFTPEWKSVVKEKNCPKLFFQTTLLPNGDVISCTPFADTVMGSLHDSSLYDIWHGKRYRHMRAFISRGLTDICYRCCDLNNDMDLDHELFRLTR